MQDLLVYIIAAPEWLARQFMAVLAYPLTPSTRIYLLYLASSLLFAIFAYSRLQRDKQTSLAAFLFPRDVWKNPSAWLDVRYFFFHQIFRLVIYGAFLAGVSVFVFEQLVGEPAAHSATGAGWPLELLYVVFAALALDFVAYVMHYLQHKVPLLWEFHKVHHSATVMHPLTNYREHPVDNLCYALLTGTCAGLLMAGSATLIGYVPQAPTILGVGVFMFAYNLLGYNLRHSHIWVRWPGRLSMVFGSPAHHQVHHSYHPEHIDHNFAFMFPVWDVIFGTYCVPETNKDVRFGLHENQQQEYTSVLGVYFVPVRNALRLLLDRERLQVRD